MNVIAQLEFELTCYDIVVHNVSHYGCGTPLNLFRNNFFLWQEYFELFQELFESKLAMIVYKELSLVAWNHIIAYKKDSFFGIKWTNKLCHVMS